MQRCIARSILAHPVSNLNNLIQSNMYVILLHLSKHKMINYRSHRPLNVGSNSVNS